MVACSPGSGRTATDLSMPIELPGLFRGCQRRMQQTDDVLWYELKPQRCAEGFEAKDVQIFVEIAHPRRQRNRFNAGLYRALRENRLYGISGSIVIAGDI